MYRQGDVLIVPVKRVPTKLAKADPVKGRVVLAYGEATGHHHSFSERQGLTLYKGATLDDPDYLIVGGGSALLEHQEHDTIHVPPGKYRVIRQREYIPQAIRRVAD